MKQLTIKDIAKKAGVTKATVSMVINNYPRIPQATKDRIWKIMRELDFHPNESARVLAKGKTEAIAFIATRFAAPFISNVLDAFEQRAFYANRYVHGIVPYSTRNEEDVKELFLKKILKGNKADAVVVLTIKPSDEMVAAYKKAGKPLVLIENRIKDAHSIIIDNVAGAEKAAAYFVKTGRKNIGLIVGETVQPPSKDNNMPAVDRRAGFKAGLEKAGMDLPDKNIEIIHAYNYEEGKRSLDNFIKRGVKLDAIFCASGDIVAMGLLERANELGIRIPDDLAIIGFDDVLAARHLNPPLTTVRQPLDEVGVMAFDIAVDAIDGKLKKFKHVTIVPELIIRKSA
jgi:DNA-binding LacI/PurR family transcriptional regulator